MSLQNYMKRMSFYLTRKSRSKNNTRNISRDRTHSDRGIKDTMNSIMNRHMKIQLSRGDDMKSGEQMCSRSKVMKIEKSTTSKQKKDQLSRILISQSLR